MSTQKRWVAWTLVLALPILGGVGYQRWRATQSNRVTFRQVQVKRGDLRASILSTGIVQPENRVGIKPPIGGRVEKVLVSEGQRVKKGQLLAWISSTERAALLDAAQARGPDELKQWEELYRPTPILAAIDGTIIQKNVESGQSFTTADEVLVMSDRLTVKAQVDETDIAQIKLKQEASIQLDAYPGEKVDANVDQIAFDAKTVNSVTTYIVDVLPTRPPGFMRSGMTATVTFFVASKSAVLWIPADAIKSSEGHETVLVLLPGSSNGNFQEREVKSGLTDGKRFEIVSGLQEGETVLVPEFKMEKKQSGGSPFSPMGHASGSKGH